MKIEAIQLRLLDDVLLTALREDVGSGDLTSRATIAEDAQALAQFVPKQDVVVSGLPVVRRLAELVDGALEVHLIAEEGTLARKGSVIAELGGSARSILIAERVALNLLQRMCGIATLTNRYVERLKGTRARVVDTRKTVPGFRVLDKYAVACGGGMNHRMGLFDGVLIKNNHLKFHPSISCAIQAARLQLGYLVKIEVEIPDPGNVVEAISSGADVILLDNLTVEQTREAVRVCGGRVPLESSGGVTLETIRDFAEAGVDYISVGALTHSVPAADIHLRVTPVHGSQA